MAMDSPGMSPLTPSCPWAISLMLSAHTDWGQCQQLCEPVPGCLPFPNNQKKKINQNVQIVHFTANLMIIGYNKLGVLVFAENKYFNCARLHLLKWLPAPPRAGKAHLGRRGCSQPSRLQEKCKHQLSTTPECSSNDKAQHS